MKKLIIGIIIVLISIVLWMFLSDKDEKSQAKSGGSTPTEEKLEEEKQLFLKERERAINHVMAGLNSSFQFLGKMVDQNGDPIEGVKITSRISQPKGMWSSNTVLKVVRSGADGTFNVANKGSGISFESFEKEGYRKTKGQVVSFSYGSSPAMIPRHDGKVREYTMIKESEIQKLMESSRQLTLNWGGVPLFYDFKSKKFGKSGELKITALRGQVKGEYRDARYDWSVRVEVPGGGVVETVRESAFIAPEKGYQPFWSYEELSTNPKFGGAKNNTFLHLHFPDGTYGRLEISVDAAPENRISGRIRSAVNPSGSRVLE